MPKVEYSSNNSGGRWWLTDENWISLESAGWKVNWVKDDPPNTPYTRNRDGSGRWLGGLATNAERFGLSLPEAVEEWERVTGCCSTDAGCPCCGSPHSFTEYDDDGNYLRSGPETSYTASW